MNNRGSVIIVPDEEVIMQPLFERGVPYGEDHTKFIQEFSDMYHLGFTFSNNDYQEAPTKLASSGHLVVKSEDDSSLIVLYLPEVITDRQLDWYYQNEEKLEQYHIISAYSKQRYAVNEDLLWKEIYDIGNLRREMNQKNSIGKKR